MRASGRPRLVLVMGVAGSGKTTLGRRLAARLGCDFLDADDFHSAEAVAMMRSGTALTPALRDAWVEALRAALLERHAAGRDVVLAFSGLRAHHRRRLLTLPFASRGFMLQVATPELATRLTRRHAHFMPASQLPDQLATLEPLVAGDGITPIDAGGSVEAVVEAMCAALES